MAQDLPEHQVKRFERLAWPYLPLLLRTAQYLTPRLQDAEDLAQETLLKALRAMDSFQEGTDIKAWLLTILRRTHIDRIRLRGRRGPEVSLDEALATASDLADSATAHPRWDAPQDLLQRFEDQAIIDALKALPEDIRWTLLLVDVEGLEHAQAAQVLDVPLGTIKSRAHRGRAMLRDRLYPLAQSRGWLPNPSPRNSSQ